MDSAEPLNSKQKRLQRLRGRHLKDAVLPIPSSTPRSLSLLEFTAARSKEIVALKNQVANASANSRAFQELPKHLRRRAMSHNVHRIPARLREKAVAELERVPAKTPSVPKRRERRRPSRMLKEHERRQRNQIWLETHIWHAKRMHMKSLFGYRISIRPSDKGERATLKATEFFSTLYDASYMSCLQLKGALTNVVRVLGAFCSAVDLQKLQTKSRLEGGVVLDIFMYERNAVSKRGLAAVQLQWRPLSTASSSSLWIWVHPSAAKTTLEMLTAEAASFASDTSVESLDGELLRFELRGLRAQSVISTVLRPASGDTNSAAGQFWEALRHVRSTSSLPSGAILALKVSDPRFFSTSQRLLAAPARDNDNSVPSSVQAALLPALQSWPCAFACSPLWEASGRTQASDRASSKSESCWVPVLLVQRASACQHGFGSGWDIVLPKGWGMAFWTALVFAGGRAIGLRDRRVQLLEQALASFPEDFPDTAAGAAFAAVTTEETKSDFLKRPPAKRPNFVANNVPTPFRPCWELVLDSSAPSLNVMRSSSHADDGTLLQQVELRVRFRGTPDANAFICVPTTTDLVFMQGVEARHWQGVEEPLGQSQPQPQARAVLGCVLRGTFSRLRGFGFGIGFVSRSKLLQCHHLRDPKRPSRYFVLLRNPTSRHYLQAFIEPGKTL